MNSQNRDEPHIHRAEDVRQGEIILRKRWQRVLFIAGLAASVIVVALLRIHASA